MGFRAISHKNATGRRGACNAEVSSRCCYGVCMYVCVCVCVCTFMDMLMCVFFAWFSPSLHTFGFDVSRNLSFHVYLSDCMHAVLVTHIKNLFTRVSHWCCRAISRKRVLLFCGKGGMFSLIYVWFTYTFLTICMHCWQIHSCQYLYILYMYIVDSVFALFTHVL